MDRKNDSTNQMDGMMKLGNGDIQCGN